MIWITDHPNYHNSCWLKINQSSLNSYANKVGGVLSLRNEKTPVSMFFKRKPNKKQASVGFELDIYEIKRNQRAINDMIVGKKKKKR